MDLYSIKIQKILKIKNFKEISQLKSLENRIMKLFSLKYNSHCKFKNKQFTYNNLILENLMFNKNCHIVAVFKDYMIIDYIDEFLKRKYSRKESKIRIPNFSYFYKNYSRFFCIPTYSDFYFNNLIQNNNEKKAQFFFNENYINKKQSKESKINEGILIYPHNEDSINNSSNKILKTFFNESIRKKIEKDSPARNSIVLNESETKLKNDESGLLNSFSNENSLNYLMKELNNKNAPKLFDKNSKEKLNNNEDNKLYDISPSPINKIKKNGNELIGQKKFQNNKENNSIEYKIKNNNNLIDNNNKESFLKDNTNLFILNKNNSAINISTNNISKNIYPNSNIIKNIKLINTKKIIKRNNNNYTTIIGLKNNNNKKIQSKNPIIQIIKMKYLNNNSKSKTFNLNKNMNISNLLLNNNIKDNNIKNTNSNYLIIKSRNIQNKKNKENSFKSNSFNINLIKKFKNKNNNFLKNNTRNYLNYKYDSHINLSKVKNKSYFKESDTHSIIKKSKEKDSISKVHLSSINFYKKNKKIRDNSRSFTNIKKKAIISDKVIFNKTKNKNKGNTDSNNRKKTFYLLKKNVNSIKNIENENLYKTFNILKKKIPINVKNINENNSYKKYSSSIQNIQNVNININNQINISDKQIKELISFYNNKKDNHNSNINLKESKSFLNCNKNLIEKKKEGNKMSNQRNNYINSFKSFTFIKENNCKNIIKSNDNDIHNLKLFYNSKTKKSNK